MNRRHKYEDEDQQSTTNLDALRSRKLAVDLRQHIRTLSSRQIFSAEWLQLVEQLQHVTNIAMMEQRLPKKDGEAGTLWDRDELTVRFILEEGKLNMAVRLLVQVMEMQRSKFTYEQRLGVAASELGISETSLESRLGVFEHSMGLLVECCLRSVEATQTVDLNLLFKHCADCLNDLNEMAELPSDLGTFEKCQQCLVVHYLRNMMRQVENLRDAQVFSTLELDSLVPRLVRALKLYGGKLSPTWKQAGLETLHLIASHELFVAHEARLLPTADAKQDVVALRPLLAEYTADDATRRQIQGVCDLLQKYEGMSRPAAPMRYSGAAMAARLAAIAAQPK